MEPYGIDRSNREGYDLLLTVTKGNSFFEVFYSMSNMPAAYKKHYRNTKTIKKLKNKTPNNLLSIS